MRMPRRRLRISAALASLTLLAAGTSAGAQPQTQAGPPSSPALAAEVGSAGVGDAYFPQDGNGGIDVRSYRIRQRWLPGTQRLRGRTTVRLSPTVDLRRFNLDFLLPVSRVTVNGSPARFTRPTRHELTITPSAPLTRGSVATVQVSYSGHPLQARYAGESGMLYTRDTLVAVNQPHIAPYWFPANDHPSDRATFDVTTTVPKGQQVIGNGRLVSRRSGATTTTWRWKAAEPMATYLAYFVAGPLSMERRTDAAGRPVWYALSKRLTRQQRQAVVPIVKQTPAITRWLERELGRPYPWRTTGAVVVPGLGFALETQGRPVYSTWVDQNTVVHELAHQWFGDQVTIDRWKDIWLNEGFASYLEWLHQERHGGLSVHENLMDAWSMTPASSSFWTVAPAAPGAANIFDSAVYSRGAMALAALRHRLGAGTMRTLLTAWLARQAGKSVRTRDFVALAEEISGEDLDGFFEAWLHAERRPDRTAANGLA